MTGEVVEKSTTSVAVMKKAEELRSITSLHGRNNSAVAKKFVDIKPAAMPRVGVRLSRNDSYWARC